MKKLLLIVFALGLTGQPTGEINADLRARLKGAERDFYLVREPYQQAIEAAQKVITLMNQELSRLPEGQALIAVEREADSVCKAAGKVADFKTLACVEMPKQ